MAPGWEMGFGMDLGFGMGAPAAAPTTTPPSFLYGLPAAADNMRVDDLLDLPNDISSSTAMVINDAELYPSQEPSSTINCSQPFISGDSDSSSSFNLYHPHLNSFPTDLYVPSEEAAELEWLSKFVDDSFSDVPLSCNMMAPSFSTITRAENNPSTVIPGRGARSKRSRVSNTNAMAAAATWSSYTSPTLAPHHQQQHSTSSTSSSSSSDFPSGKPRANINSSASSGMSSGNGNSKGKKGVNAADGIGVESGVRRCTHCASDKTPQWRTGPLGPKTLCNACGVRFKSGRLVPEYRPAASPTFVLTQHSNSHRKVLELRRQKELLLLSQQNNSSNIAVATRPDQLLRDYEVC